MYERKDHVICEGEAHEGRVGRMLVELLLQAVGMVPHGRQSRGTQHCTVFCHTLMPDWQVRNDTY